MEPKEAIVSLIASLTLASSATSPLKQLALDPNSLAANSSDSSFISYRQTLAPASTKFRAVANPNPEAPPVIKAVLFANSIIISLPLKNLLRPARIIDHNLKGKRGQ